MFLITTADRRFWKTDSKALFLGEWCKKYSDRFFWQDLNYEVMPYYGEDADQVNELYSIVTSSYEALLLSVGQALNQIHQVKHSNRYWRIVIGPWLSSFTYLVHEHAYNLSSAVGKYSIRSTFIPERMENWTPHDFNSYNHLMWDDAYHFALYSWLIKRLRLFPYEEIPGVFTIPESQLYRRGAHANRSVAKVLAHRLLSPTARYLEKVFPSETVVVGMGFPLIPLMKIQAEFGQFPRVVVPQSSLNASKFNSGMRTELETLLKAAETSSPLMTALVELVAIQIPMVHLEGYRPLESLARNSFSKKPKRILTSLAQYGDEGFKIWAGEQVEKGTPLYVIQHGGHYGSGLITPNEEHDLAISDTFFSWGWTSESHPRVCPVPSPKLAHSGRKARFRPQGHIFWALNSFYRYPYPDSMPFGPLFLGYLEDQKQFWKVLPEEIRRSTLLRPYYPELGWELEVRCRELFPDAKLSPRKRTFLQDLNGARLFVGTDNTTTYLEAMTAGIPTVQFFNPRHWALRPSAQPYFERLKEVKILHDSPESAALFIESIFQDTGAWWNTEEVVQARTQFCKRFASTDPNWPQILSREVLTSPSRL